MKKLLLLLILIIIFIISLISLNYQNTKPPFAKIDNYVFSLEIAKSQKDKEIGLSKYKSIPNNLGMLFPFEKEGNYSFWMKDMKFSIDIIFIKENKIIKIFNNVPYPKSNNEELPIYTPSGLSDMVLEINAGLSDKYKFKNGDRVEIRL